MFYINRTVEPYLTQNLGKGQAIVIYGPRQAGKTTLAKRLLLNYSSNEVAFFQADDPSQASLFVPEIAKLKLIVGNYKVIFIDEAQAITNISLILKLLVDMFPQVQIIATGSSSFELSDKIKESMVGRVLPVTLLPLSAQEIAQDHKGKLTFNIERYLKIGSYPAVVTKNDLEAQQLLQTITESYLFKDILTLADTRNPEVLRKLLTALALQIGQEVSYNELSTLLEVSRTTIERYIYLLEQCYVIFRLQPLSSNPRKLLASRKRKVYFYDIGVRNTLANQTSLPLESNPQIGGIFENYCILERLKSRLNNHIFVNANYWRSPDSELDYIEQQGNTTFAYEIKWQKIQKNPPPTFKDQFPGAIFTSINKENFWELIDKGVGL
jgi:predicted AAA+ superfamily ATPase